MLNAPPDNNEYNEDGTSLKKRRIRRSSEETRRDIVNTAERLFKENGFNSVAISDIAAELQMSPANIFKHFRSKIELVDEIVLQLISNLEKQIIILDSSNEPVTRLTHLAQHLAQRHHNDFCENPYMYEMLVLTAKRELQCGDYYRSVMMSLFKEIIDDGVNAGIYPTVNTEDTAETILDALVGTLHPIIFMNEKVETVLQRSASVIKLIDRGLRNPLA